MASDAAWKAVGLLMRSLRRGAGVSLRDAARRADFSHASLANAESGRDRPGEKLIAFYEEECRADGVLWSAYVAAKVPRVDEALRGGEEPGPYPIEGDASEFVADVTIPDGTVMRPGHGFVKTWRVRNSGVVPWIDRRLARVGPPLAHGLPRSVPSVPIPDTPPGQEADISVPMRAQFLEGSAQVTWKMIDSAGRTCFPDRYPDGLVVCIVVRGTPEA
jgi:hypothetical protein